MVKRVSLVLACAAAVLAGCASAPRAPAASLAAAGIKATGSFAAEVRSVEAQLDSAVVGDAFTATWQVCSNPNLTCEPKVPSEALTQRQHDLARVVELRARAIDALGAAYAALQAEAAYDGSADLQGAAEEAVGSVNSFAEAVGRIGGVPGAAAVSEPIQGLVGFGAGLLGERRQRERILAASRVIGAATRRLRDGMQKEAGIFDSLAGYLVDKRAAVRLAFYHAGLTSGSDILTDLAAKLDVPLVSNSGSILAGSVPLRTAIEASMIGMARLEVLAVQDRYRAAIAALGALVASHQQLEARQPLAIGDIEQFLDRLNASLAPPPPPAQSDTPTGGN
jgi:hypothetical protein